ncbi:energy transducer TonB [Yunchengibacter salinarum]|uniref:energy transducer TonB n=1 Tax=Yunchengibacter salinarum TaxID=3133399 RepID=UPI0035B59263
MPDQPVENRTRRRAVLAVVALMAALVLLVLPLTGAGASPIQDWQKALVKTITEKHVYPRSALRRELEGSARVRVTIDRSGTITGYEIVKPTGEPVFDKLIPRLMDSFSPLPAPPDSLSDNNLTFVLPLSWNLQ